jgi:proteasome accessory factor B
MRCQPLRRAGLPIRGDKTGLSIANANVLRPLAPTLNEALSLIVLADEVCRTKQIQFLDPARSAVVKLAQRLPVEIRESINSRRRSISLRLTTTANVAGKRTIFDQLFDAQMSGYEVHIEFDSQLEGERITTILRPYHLYFSRHSWYVIGHSKLHKDIKTFSVTRIVSAAKLDRRFRIPKSFSLDRYLGDAWQLIPGRNRPQHVVIRFSALVAPHVKSVGWHRTQKLHMNNDGSMDFSATVSSLDEILWWVLGYGDQAEALAPLRLRRLVARRATNLAKMYAKEIAE